MSEKELTLSIETAIQGGSISLLRGITELDYWIGAKEISKSEDVLQEIKHIFKRNNLKKEGLKKIVVSDGPGSHTGTRIGKAIGIGLSKAFECELTGVFALEAMLLSVVKGDNFDGEDEIIAAVPIGRNQVRRQSFSLQNQKNIYFKSESETELSTIEEFLDFAINSVYQRKKKIIMHRKLYLDYRANLQNDSIINNIAIDAGENIAMLNGILGV